jgi:hypothetical protein
MAIRCDRSRARDLPARNYRCRKAQTITAAQDSVRSMLFVAAVPNALSGLQSPKADLIGCITTIPSDSANAIFFNDMLCLVLSCVAPPTQGNRPNARRRCRIGMAAGCSQPFRVIPGDGLRPSRRALEVAVCHNAAQLLSSSNNVKIRLSGLYTTKIRIIASISVTEAVVKAANVFAVIVAALLVRNGPGWACATSKSALLVERRTKRRYTFGLDCHFQFRTSGTSWPC